MEVLFCWIYSWRMWVIAHSIKQNQSNSQWLVKIVFSTPALYWKITLFQFRCSINIQKKILTKRYSGFENYDFILLFKAFFCNAPKHPHSSIEIEDRWTELCTPKSNIQHQESLTSDIWLFDILTVCRWRSKQSNLWSDRLVHAISCSL